MFFEGLLWIQPVLTQEKKEYKSLICAIATDEKVKSRIVVPRSMGRDCAKLAVCKDGETTVYYNMFWAGMCGNDHEYWQLHFYATTSGLYFYHFELETPWGKTYIKNSGNGIGDFNLCVRRISANRL